MIGDVFCGVTAANYGGIGPANLGVWQVPDATEWARMSPDTFVLPYEFDFTDWVVEWLPCLGGFGFAFDETGGNRVLCARLLLPGEDTHEFAKRRRELLINAEEDAAKTGQPPLRDRGERSTFRTPRKPMDGRCVVDRCLEHGLRGLDHRICDEER